MGGELDDPKLVLRGAVEIGDRADRGTWQKVGKVEFKLVGPRLTRQAVTSLIIVQNIVTRPAMDRVVSAADRKVNCAPATQQQVVAIPSLQASAMAARQQRVVATAGVNTVKAGQVRGFDPFFLFRAVAIK